MRLRSLGPRRVTRRHVPEIPELRAYLETLELSERTTRRLERQIAKSISCYVDSTIRDQQRREQEQVDPLRDFLTRYQRIIGPSVKQLKLLESEAIRLRTHLDTAGETNSSVQSRSVEQSPLTDLPDPASVRREFEERINEWRALLRQTAEQAQQLLRRLNDGRLVLTAQEDADGPYYRFTGLGSWWRLLAGLGPTWRPIVALRPQMVASPVYASWNQLRGWLRAVDGLRRVA